MPQLIIEECTRSGAHLAYHAVNRFPLRIGRSLENDIVLADPFVSPVHLIIEDGGEAWMLFDQNSENGTFVGKDEKLKGPMCAGSGDQVTLGKTVLRLWSPSHPAGPTMLLPTPRTVAELALPPIAAFVSLLFAGGMILFQQRLDTAKQTTLVSLIAGSIPYLLMPLLWAGLWAVAGFILQRNPRYSFQLLIGNGALILFIALSLMVEYIDYATGNVAIAETVQYAGMAALATVLLFINLTLAGGMNDFRRITAAVIVGGVLVAGVAVSDHADSEENRLAPMYSHTLKPPFFRLMRAVQLDQFINESGKIFSKEKSEPAEGHP